jgi:hypothetical protein
MGDGKTAVATDMGQFTPANRRMDGQAKGVRECGIHTMGEPADIPFHGSESHAPDQAGDPHSRYRYMRYLYAVADADEIDWILSEFELAEYLCFLLKYIEALMDGCANLGDVRYCFDEEYRPDHPIMSVAYDMYENH